MKHFKIALLQMKAAIKEIDENTQIAEKFCREAAEKGSDLALFPEMFSTGYAALEGDPFGPWKAVAFENEKPDNKAIVEESSYAIDDTHPYVERFRTLAGKLEMAIAVTYMSTGDNAPQNSVLIIDRHGQDLFKYSKIHLFEPFLVDATCEPGEQYIVKDLDTKAGPVKIGAMICADRDHPEPGRILMKYGAEIVIVPNACPLKELGNGIITDMVRVRAFENAMAFAICNYPSPQQDGHSAAFAPDGSVVLRAGAEEGVYIADYDIDAIRQYRRTTNLGDAFRKERFYKPLIEAPVPEEFADRKNAVGIVRR